jgi:hypothetical protein
MTTTKAKSKTLAERYPGTFQKFIEAGTRNRGFLDNCVVGYYYRAGGSSCLTVAMFPIFQDEDFGELCVAYGKLRMEAIMREALSPVCEFTRVEMMMMGERYKREASHDRTLAV